METTTNKSEEDRDPLRGVLVCGNLSCPIMLQISQRFRNQPYDGPTTDADTDREESEALVISLWGFTSLRAIGCYPVHQSDEAGTADIAYVRAATEKELECNGTVEAAALAKQANSLLSGLVAAMVGCEYVAIASVGVSQEPSVLLWPVRVIDGTDTCSDMCLECRFVDVNKEYPGIGKLEDLSLLPFRTLSPFSRIEEDDLHFTGFKLFDDVYRNNQACELNQSVRDPMDIETAWKELQDAGDKLPNQKKWFINIAEEILSMAEMYEVDGLKDCVKALADKLSIQLQEKRQDLHSKPGSKRKSTSAYSTTKSTQKEDASILSTLQCLHEIAEKASS